MFALVPYDEIPEGEPKLYKVYAELSDAVNNKYFIDKTSIGFKSF